MRSERDAIYDELLVLRWRRDRDKAAVDELLRRWERRLLYYVRRMVDGDEQDAWDVLQQAFVHVVRKLHTLRDPRTLPAWLYAVARNAALAHKRSAISRGGRLDDAVDVAELSDAAVDDVNDFSSADVEAVHAGLAKLSVSHREALTLLFLQDLSVEQIAQVVGVSPGTVKSRVFYAKQALRAILERKDGGHA